MYHDDHPDDMTLYWSFTNDGPLSVFRRVQHLRLSCQLSTVQLNRWVIKLKSNW
jgi:hypothetical protein